MVNIKLAFGVTLLALGFSNRVLADERPVATVSAAPDEEPTCDMGGDSMLLTVRKADGSILKYAFCSAYGESKAEVVSDKIGNNYVLLTFLSGHGTHASSKYLTIYKISGRLLRRQTILLSKPSDLTGDWVYKYEVGLRDAGGLRLKMRLHHEGSDAPEVPAPAKYKVVRG